MYENICEFEGTTVEWMDWHNNRCFGQIWEISLTKFETAYYEQENGSAYVGGSDRKRP